ncbi:hypothetical protein GN958_ATG11049 [Phytophthora infestans]|uniref:EF-hand domain-containing protein n=1 Tax=Phytophthora infestans TaxID=4787 RepID=A0A8S9UN57_PHYIN|nr:hypothetical protein GN958_ATG11049 [Phytophthora infestans]
MAQQMLFASPTESWRQSPNAWTTGNDSSSPRRVVTFAVQDASPSPVVYRSRTQSPYATDLTNELPPEQRRSRSQAATQRDKAKMRPSTVRPRTRRPGWDADVNHGTTLFDASLKKSQLFQARAGDRRKEEEAERQEIARKNVVRRKKTPPARTSTVRYRSGPSSVYAQHRQNVTHWPQRRTKDFVRENIEQLTGRPANRNFGRHGTQFNTQENVSERLPAPRVSKAMLRSHALVVPLEKERDRSLSVASLSPPQSASASSPALTIDPPAPDKHNSPHSTTPSPGKRRRGLGWSSPYSSPQRSQQSFSSRHSPAVHSISTNRSGDGSHTQRYDNYPTRVFGVLDRDNDGRIGVSQILQGLRLLGLPATHNQISDYVYLIHEGRHNSIDLEEWEILVGTLDAASRPSSDIPRNAQAGQGSAIQSRSPSSRDITAHSPYSSMPPSTSPRPKSHHPSSLTPKQRDQTSTRTRRTSHDNDMYFSTSVQREAIVAAGHQPISQDDPYLEEIQNRIEGMFERAQATAALRWAPEARTSQVENEPEHSRSDRILKQAANVVYSLRASLFPLVHQAEATLREIQQRHGSKLSLFLPSGDLAAIAQNSDVLASAILDDILLDTVQLLNEEDKQQSYRHLELHHADQLDDILARIQEIEHEENKMIHQGLALSYQTQGVKCHLPTASLHGGLDPELAKPSQHKSVPNLTLPLEVVMNINVPADADLSPPEHDMKVTGSMVFDEDECDSIEFGHPGQVLEMPVRTSILQGKRLQSIERRRHKFLHHRRLVESSLAETGMTQCAVIEILEEMLLDDLVDETAAELDDTVISMSDTLLTNLL